MLQLTELLEEANFFLITHVSIIFRLQSFSGREYYPFRIFTLGRPFNRLITRLNNYVCMRRPPLTVSKYRNHAGF